jgi:hypothetical protein
LIRERINCTFGLVQVERTSREEDQWQSPRKSGSGKNSKIKLKIKIKKSNKPLEVVKGWIKLYFYNFTANYLLG